MFCFPLLFKPLFSLTVYLAGLSQCLFATFHCCANFLATPTDAQGLLPPGALHSGFTRGNAQGPLVVLWIEPEPAACSTLYYASEEA